MTTLTEEELNALDGGLQDASFDRVTANNFVGHLTGVADKAKELYESQALVLQGDASGKTYIGKGNASITVTVHESEHAKVADYCGNATDSLNASKADLANIATYAYKSGKAEHAVESDHAAESDHATESDHALNADNANVADVALKDNAGHKIDETLTTLIDNDSIIFSHLDYVDEDIATLKNDVKTNASGIESNRTDIDANTANIDTLQGIVSSHTESISEHESRLNNLEDTTDIGQFAVRMEAVETKNTAQDTRLSAVETKNSEQDTRLSAVESVNTVQTTNLNNHLNDTSAHSNVFAKYLPLSGGQMSGSISKINNNSSFQINGGTDWRHGASIMLIGDEHSERPGELELTVGSNGEEISTLQLKKTSITWMNKHLVRSINGTYADEKGNVEITSVTNATNATNATNDGNGNAISSTYLPLSGGRMSGNIHKNTDSGQLEIDGGTAWNTGGGIVLTGKDSSSAGMVSIRPNNGTNNSILNAYPDGTLQWNSIDIIPIGEVRFFAQSSAPTGYLVCNGAEVSRTTYASLFSAIGETYGSGDGSSTFNLPNLIDRFAQGSTTVGTYKSAGLPDHTHTYIDYYAAFSQGHGGSTPVVSSYNEYARRTTGKASDVNSIYGNSSTVQPPALTLLPCIKY